MKADFIDGDLRGPKADGQWAEYNESRRLIGTRAFDDKVQQTHDRLAALGGKKYIIAWSGGKDSQVLKHIAQDHACAGPAFVVSNDLEFPSVNRFFARHLDARYILRLPYNWKFLMSRPMMLWSDDETLAYIRRQKWAMQDRCATQLRAYGIMFGRRSRDSKRLSADGRKGVGGGNFTGNAEGVYKTKNSDIWRCNPLHDWSNAEVYAYIHQHNLELYPPYYYGPNRIGLVKATTEGWFQWVGKSEARPPINAWRILRDWCDPQLVEDAAQYFPLARRAISEI